MRNTVIILNFLCIILLCGIGSAQENPPLEELLAKVYKYPDSGRTYFRDATALIKKRADSASFFYYKVFLERDLGRHDSAMYYADKAIPLLEKLDSLNRLGNVYKALGQIKRWEGQYEDALFYYQKGALVAKEIPDLAQLSEQYTLMSLTLHDFEMYEIGIERGKAAVQILEQHDISDIKALIRANNAIAINFDDWNEPDSALAYHYKNVRIIETTPDSTGYGYVFNNIGNTLIKKKEFQRARENLYKALRYNLQISDDRSTKNYSLATTYNNLATLSYRLNDIGAAKNYFDKALEYSLKSKSIEKIRDVALDQVLFYKNLGDYKRAMDLQEQYYELRDSVFNFERAKSFAEMEVKYETEKKERQLLEQNQLLIEQDLRARRKNLLLVGSLVLAILIGVISYFVYKQQKLDNARLLKEAELQSALAKIEMQNKLQEERLRISRDLHDNIGSQLTFIISSIDNLRYGFRMMMPKMETKLSEINQFTEGTITELRDTIWAMNKTEITFEDLQARLANFIEKAGKSSGNINFRFIVDPAIKSDQVFTSIQGINIYRIIQEAVHNALKHSEAENIDVEIKEMETFFQIEISDDGKGFDEKEINFGHGINNMKKRASDLGLPLELVSCIRKGTTVRLG